MLVRTTSSIFFIAINLLLAVATTGALLEVESLYFLGPVTWGWIGLISAVVSSVLFHLTITCDEQIMYMPAMVVGFLIKSVVAIFLFVCSPALLMLGFWALLSGNFSPMSLPGNIQLIIGIFSVLAVSAFVMALSE